MHKKIITIRLLIIIFEDRFNLCIMKKAKVIQEYLWLFEQKTNGEIKTYGFYFSEP